MPQVSKARGITRKFWAVPTMSTSRVLQQLLLHGALRAGKGRAGSSWGSCQNMQMGHRPARALGRELLAPAKRSQQVGDRAGGGERPPPPATPSPAVLCQRASPAPEQDSCRPYLGRQPGRERGAQAPSAGRRPPGPGGRPCHRRVAASGAPGPGAGPRAHRGSAWSSGSGGTQLAGKPPAE